MRTDRTVAIIQARMGSTRLPGKVLKGIGGKSMLEHVVARTERAETLDEIVVATTTEPEDEAIVSVAGELEVPVFRGRQQDVLDRYYHAARKYDADVIVRITSDCPLTDPSITDRAVRAFKEHAPDYASTSLEQRVYPRGIGAEVMTFEALQEAWEQADESYERSHVTAYIYQHPERFQLLRVPSQHGDYSHHRWTVDTPDDLAFVRAVYRRLNDSFASWTEVLEVVEGEVELMKINESVQQKKLEEG